MNCWDVIIMAKFKKGDRVEFTSHNPVDSKENLTLGQVGVVQEVNDSDFENHLNVYVIWKVEECKINSHWWVRDVDISLETVNLINE